VTDPREEIIRRGFEATNRGDPAAALAFLDPEIEVRTETQAGPPGLYTGHEGYLEWNQAWMEVWDDFRWELGELEQHGDHFIGEVVSTGRGRGSGIELSQALTWVFTVPGERATRIGLYRDREAALAAITA
jgi:ketosteroid isomerase-like protein